MCEPSSSELRARNRRPESRSRHVAVAWAHTKVLLQGWNTVALYCQTHLICRTLKGSSFPC